MKRALLVLLCVLLLTGVCFAEEADEVSELNIDVTVDRHGRCDVTVNAALSLTSKHKEIVFPLAADAASITASGGSEYTTETLDGVKCVRFTSDAGFTGAQSFTCTYRLNAAVVNTEDGRQELTLNLPERGWEYPVSHYSVHVSMPYEPGGQLKWSGTYYENTLDNYLNVTLNGGDLNASSTEYYRDHQAIRLVVPFEAETFQLLNQKGSTVSVTKILFWLTVAAGLIYWFLRLRGRMLYLPVEQQSPPTEATAGELSCQLFGEEPDIAATLIHWANLGYLSLRRNRNGKIYIKKQMDMGNERKPAERKLFYAVFRYGPVCGAQQLRERRGTATAAHALRTAWSQRLFFHNGGSPYVLSLIGALTGLMSGILLYDTILPTAGIRWFLLPLLSILNAVQCYLIQNALRSFCRRRYITRIVLGMISAVVLVNVGIKAENLMIAVLALLMQGFCAAVTLFGGRRTPAGIETVRKLLGLRRYLRRLDAETLQRLNAQDELYFYRTLPFAEMLGVSREFVKRCSGEKLEDCPWLIDAKPVPKTAQAFYKCYGELVSTLRDEPFGLSLESVRRFFPHRRTEKAIPVRRRVAHRAPTHQKRAAAPRRRLDRPKTTAGEES